MVGFERPGGPLVVSPGRQPRESSGISSEPQRGETFPDSWFDGVNARYRPFCADVPHLRCSIDSRVRFPGLTPRAHNESPLRGSGFAPIAPA